MADGSPEPKAALFLALVAMNVAAVGMYWYARSMKEEKKCHLPCAICKDCDKSLEKSTKATSTSENLSRPPRRAKFPVQYVKTARKHKGKRRNEVKLLVSGEETKTPVVSSHEIPTEDRTISNIGEQQELGIRNMELNPAKGVFAVIPNSQKENNVRMKLRSALLNSYECTTTFIQSMGEKCLPALDHLNARAADALHLEKHLDTYTQVMVDTLVNTICSTAEQISESEPHQNQNQATPMVSHNVYNTVVLYNNAVDPKQIDPMDQNDDLPSLHESVVLPTTEGYANNGTATHLCIPGFEIPREVKNSLGSLQIPYDRNAGYHNPDGIHAKLLAAQNGKKLVASSHEDQGRRADSVENEGRSEYPDHLFSIVLKVLESWNRRKPDNEKSIRREPTNLEKREISLLVEDLLKDFICNLELDSKNCPIMGTVVDSSLLSVGDSESNEIRARSRSDRQFVIWGQSSLEKRENNAEKSCPYLFFDSGAREIPREVEEKAQLKKYISQESIHSCKESLTEGEFYECDLASHIDNKSDLSGNTISALSFSKQDINDECWNDCIADRNGPEFTENPSTSQQLLEFFGPDSIPLGSPAFFEEVAKEYQENKLD